MSREVILRENRHKKTQVKEENEPKTENTKQLDNAEAKQPVAKQPKQEAANMENKENDNKTENIKRKRRSVKDVKKELKNIMEPPKSSK